MHTILRPGPMSLFAGTALALLASSSALAAEPAKKVDPARYLSQPLVSEIYTADPSAHVWDGKIYIYPSHDIDGPTPEDDLGAHFEMRRLPRAEHGQDRWQGHRASGRPACDQVPWASKQMWAPDAAKKNDTYYLYFPAKDKQGAFRIGVATSKSPVGPFKAQPQPIKGSFSIDPAVFTDTDGKTYMYFGGIWGGQLQRNVTGSYDPNGSKTDLMADDKPALTPKVALLTRRHAGVCGKAAAMP